MDLRMKNKKIFLGCLFGIAAFTQKDENIIFFLKEPIDCNYFRLMNLAPEKHIKTLEHVIDLNLSKNFLSNQYCHGFSIGDALKKCPNVKHLNLSDNGLYLILSDAWGIVGKDIGFLDKLKCLDISRNGIRKLKKDSFKQFLLGLFGCNSLEIIIFTDSDFEESQLCDWQRKILFDFGFRETNEPGVWHKVKLESLKGICNEWLVY